VRPLRQAGRLDRPRRDGHRDQPRVPHRPLAPRPEAVTASDRPPRAGLALGAVTAAVVIVTLATTILNVATPTIRHHLHTTLASLQWVIAGYSLPLASLLTIGGRVGDLYGTRRAFVGGALLFATGSLVASLATAPPTLVLGESVIEGVGAS